MPGYATITRTLRLGGKDYRIRSLSDKQQFADPDQHAELLGISSAQWSLFGQAWPAGRLLAEAMSEHNVAGKRILELGCGLGLASLVLQRRGADITASDMHPLTEVFLAYNAALNDLPAIRYRPLQWDGTENTLGRFDIIIGSDILYERGHAELLAGVVERHAQPCSEVLLTDAGRGHSARFTRLLKELGYTVDEQRHPLSADDQPPFRGRLLSFRRAGAMAVQRASSRVLPAQARVAD